MSSSIPHVYVYSVCSHAYMCALVQCRIPWVCYLSVSCIVEASVSNVEQNVACILPPSNELLWPKKTREPMSTSYPITEQRLEDIFARFAVRSGDYTLTEGFVVWKTIWQLCFSIFSSSNSKKWFVCMLMRACMCVWERGGEQKGEKVLLFVLEETYLLTSNGLDKSIKSTLRSIYISRDLPFLNPFLWDI